MFYKAYLLFIFLLDLFKIIASLVHLFAGEWGLKFYAVKKNLFIFYFLGGKFIRGSSPRIFRNDPKEIAEESSENVQESFSYTPEPSVEILQEIKPASFQEDPPVDKKDSEPLFIWGISVFTGTVTVLNDFFLSDFAYELGLGLFGKFNISHFFNIQLGANLFYRYSHTDNEKVKGGYYAFSDGSSETSESYQMVWEIEADVDNFSFEVPIDFIFKMNRPNGVSPFFVLTIAARKPFYERVDLGSHARKRDGENYPYNYFNPWPNHKIYSDFLPAETWELVSFIGAGVQITKNISSKFSWIFLNQEFYGGHSLRNPSWRITLDITS